MLKIVELARCRAGLGDLTHPRYSSSLTCVYLKSGMVKRKTMHTEQDTVIDGLSEWKETLSGVRDGIHCDENQSTYT